MKYHTIDAGNRKEGNDPQVMFPVTEPAAEEMNPWHAQPKKESTTDDSAMLSFSGTAPEQVLLKMQHFFGRSEIWNLHFSDMEQSVYFTVFRKIEKD